MCQLHYTIQCVPQAFVPQIRERLCANLPQAMVKIAKNLRCTPKVWKPRHLQCQIEVFVPNSAAKTMTKQVPMKASIDLTYEIFGSALFVEDMSVVIVSTYAKETNSKLISCSIQGVPTVFIPIACNATYRCDSQADPGWCSLSV